MKPTHPIPASHQPGKRRTPWLPGAATLLCALTMVLGCGTEAPPMGETVTGRDSLPVMVTHGVSKLISDSGIMRYKIITEEWRVYDKTNPPRWEFPKGIFIERYDNKFKVDLHITADTAWLYNQKLWKLRGHIVLDDKMEKTHMTTEELYWDMNTGELWSNAYSRLTEPDQEIEGDWFRATLRDGHPTEYHVKQSRGFMPMGDIDKTSSPAPTSTTDTAKADSVPLRSGPSRRPKNL